VAVQSIGTAIEIGDVAGDHFFIAASEMSLGKMNGVGKVDYLAQKIRARAEALDDARDLLPAGTRAPIIVGGKRIACGFGIFGDSDFCGGLPSRLGCWKLGLIVVVIRHSISILLSRSAAKQFIHRQTSGEHERAKQRFPRASYADQN
jgi:hypothetical protein